MASRFGGVSPAQTYATKVRWLVGCLVSIIIVLAAAFIIVAQNSGPAKDGQAVATEQASTQPVLPGKSEVLVALSRIEEGTPLKPELFSAILMDESQIPMGALRKQDLPKVQEKFAGRLINPSVPVVIEDVTDKRGFSALNIPAGYRAVTIVVDRRSGVEGFARPDSRVDVLWAFVRDGKQQVATIVRTVKVLSVAGMTAAAKENGAAAPADQAGQTTVTLLATEIDAKKIELARNTGTVSLSLVGDIENVANSNEPKAVTVNDLLNEQEAKPTGPSAPAEPAADGVMYSTDPKTGKQVRYILQPGTHKWVQDKGF